MRTTGTPTLAALLPFALALGACDVDREAAPPPDLPPVVAERVLGPEPVPADLLPLDDLLVQRVAIGLEGERIFGTVREEGEMNTRLVEWRWSDEAERWDGPHAIPFSDGSQPDDAVALAPDGSHLLFASPRATDNPAAFDFNIWVSRWDEPEVEGDEGGWSDPWLVPSVHSPAWDGAPSMAGNGNLYFASEREGLAEGRNLYLSELEGGMWEAPVKLPDGINTTADETDPWVAPDESFLLFASNRDGAWDLYVSFATDGQWGEPRALASPIVTDGIERAPALSLGGQALFFVREDGELWWAPSAAAGVGEPEPRSEEDAGAYE